MRISDWSSDVCSSDLTRSLHPEAPPVMDGASCFWAPLPPDRGRYSGESAMEDPSLDHSCPSPDHPRGGADLLDHRDIGNRQSLFHQQEDGPGMVFWHPRGFALSQAVEGHIRRPMRHTGYREMRTPPLLSRDPWE